MAPKNGIQREIYQGIPIWRNDARDMFIYQTEEPRIKIGDSKGFLPNWKEIYEPFLKSFRDKLETRHRLPSTR